MTRQHFQALADEIAKIADNAARKLAAQAAARACKQFNGKFNEFKFYDACGVHEY